MGRGQYGDGGRRCWRAGTGAHSGSGVWGDYAVQLLCCFMKYVWFLPVMIWYCQNNSILVMDFLEYELFATKFHSF